MKKIILASLVTSILLLQGCGGGGDTTATNSTTPNTNQSASNGKTLIASFSSIYESKPYNFINQSVLFNVPGLSTFIWNPDNVNIYSDGSVETVNPALSTSYDTHDNGLVQRVFITLNASNGTINAVRISGDWRGITFYDQATKTYYEVQSTNATNLIAISNDGLTAVAQAADGTTSNVTLTRSYREVDLSQVGISLATPPLLYQGVGTDVIESGFTSYGESGNFYNIDGKYYLYKVQGVSFLNAQYVLYANGNVSGVNSTGSTQNGYVSQYYRRIKVANQNNVNFGYVASITYYDSVNKIFYETSGTDGGASAITAITNDGNTAVLSSGAVVQVLKTYQKVE